MSMLPSFVADIISSYEARRKACGFEYRPPTGKEQLGEFAFASDVIDKILVGVVTKLLSDALVMLFRLFKDRLKGRGTDSVEKPEELVVHVLDREKVGASLEEGVTLLEAQGIAEEDGWRSMGILLDVVQDTVRQKLS